MILNIIVDLFPALGFCVLKKQIVFFPYVYNLITMLQVGCAMWIPGRYFQGCELRGGGRLSYRCNGQKTCVIHPKQTHPK